MKKYSVVVVIFGKLHLQPVSYGQAIEAAGTKQAAQKVTKQLTKEMDSNSFDESGVVEFEGTYMDELTFEKSPCRIFVRELGWKPNNTSDPVVGEDGIGAAVRMMYTPDEVTELYDRGFSRDEVRRSARLGRRIA